MCRFRGKPIAVRTVYSRPVARYLPDAGASAPTGTSLVPAALAHKRETRFNRFMTPAMHTLISLSMFLSLACLLQFNGRRPKKSR